MNESTVLHAALLGDSPIPMGLIDLDGTFRDMNRAAEILTGFSAAEVVGTKPPFPWDRPGEEDAVRHDLENAVSEKGARIERNFRKKSGELFTAQVLLKQVAGEDLEPCLLVTIFDVTERKRTEDLIRLQRDLAIALSSTSELDEALQAVLRAATQIEGIDCGGVYVLDDLDGQLRMVAHQGISPEFAATVARYEPGSERVDLVLAGKPAYRRFDQFDFNQEQDLLREGLRAFAVLPIMYEGEVVAVLNLASHTHDEIPATSRDAVEAIAAQAGGVIARVHVENSLRRSRRNLENCFNTLDDLVFVIGLGGRIIHVNSQVERRLGYAAEELLDKHVIEMHPPDRREEASEIFAEMVTGKTNHCPIPLQAMDGTLIEVETKITRGEWDGQPVFFGISRDIRERLETERRLRDENAFRRRTERALRDSQDKLAGVLDAVTDNISMIDEEHEIVWANGVAKQLYGADLVGRKCYRVYHGHDKPCEQCLTQRTFADSRTHELERKAVSGDEERTFWCTSSVAARHDDGRPRLVIEVVRDVTARRKAEHESREHLSELAHVTRLATMGEMASGIAHEVNQPLTAISSYAGTGLNILERSSAPAPEEIRQLFARIEQQAVRAGQLVHGMRRFVRRSPPVRATSDLNELVGEALGWMQPDLERAGVTLKQSLADLLPAVAVDPIQIEQVILNLVINAVDALSSESNGRRELSVSTEISASDQVQVAVRDSGPGVTAEDGERIFDAFVTTKPGGLGMGLAISRSIVETHGGRLWMTPNSDRGCTFRFDLPLSAKSRVSGEVCS